jgi:DNA polymerase III alpha subunit
VPVKKLPGLAKKAGMPAVALTDTNNMFAALEFSVGAQGEGVQPILGCQVALSYEASEPGGKPKMPAPVVLLAQNEAGYLNLLKLNSCLYLGDTGQLPQVTMAQLTTHSGGLICLTGGPEGPVGRQFFRDAAQRMGSGVAAGARLRCRQEHAIVRGVESQSADGLKTWMLRRASNASAGHRDGNCAITPARWWWPLDAKARNNWKSTQPSSRARSR